MAAETANEEIARVLRSALIENTLIALVMSDARQRGPGIPARVGVKPALVRGERLYQFEYRIGDKATHRNLRPDEAQAEILALLTGTFRQAQLYTTTADYRIVIREKGRAAVRALPPSKTAPDLNHDRKKNRLLAEGEPLEFLVRLGVTSADGRVIATKYDKFRQINRFLEMVADVVDNLDASRPITVVDFGCGKAYLTFALYHYLRTLKGFDVRMVGVDLKADVIAECNRIAADLGYETLRFLVGDIQGYHDLDSVDMMVSLHACDTATDDALIKAIRWNAKVILSVPCCQHELFTQIRSEAMQPMLKHGLVKERLSALITDCLRAGALEAQGYAVQMLEFVETEHTPKNILLRAVKRSRPSDREKRVEEYRALRDFWHVHPAIDAALGD